MHTTVELSSMLGRALDAATAVVDGFPALLLPAPTPCAGWSVGELLGHMIGQYRGFARAISDGDADVVDFRPVPADRSEVHIQHWHDSIAQLRAAVQGATGGGTIRLVEIDELHRFELAQVLGIQLLDTAVHTWDLATAAGSTFRPADDILSHVENVADRIPSGPARTVSAAFAQPRSVASDDRWILVLAHLGRTPNSLPR